MTSFGLIPVHKTGKTIGIACAITAALALGMSAGALADTGSAESSRIRTVTIGSDLWCPYSCEAEDAMQGYLVDVVRAAMATQGIEVKYKVLPWSRAYIQGETGKIDMVLGLVPGDEGRLAMSTVPLAWDSTVMVVRKGEKFRYAGPGSLDGMRIGTTAEYTYDNGGDLDEYLQKRRDARDRITEIFSSNPLHLLFGMLTRNRIDVFPENAEVTLYEARELGLEDQISLVETGSGNTIHVGFPPTEAGRLLLAQFDASVRQLIQSGQLDQIRMRYAINSGITINVPPGE